MARATVCRSPTACTVSLQIVLGFSFIHSTSMKIPSHRAFQGEQRIVEIINWNFFLLRDVVLATLMDSTRETWSEAQVMYTYPKVGVIPKCISKCIPKCIPK